LKPFSRTPPEASELCAKKLPEQARISRTLEKVFRHLSLAFQLSAARIGFFCENYTRGVYIITHWCLPIFESILTRYVCRLPRLSGGPLGHGEDRRNAARF
jgi:hypothetical protein